MFNTLFVLMLTSVSDVRAPAPQAGCLDARRVTQMQQITSTELLVKTQSARYQLYLADVCNAHEPGTSLLASDGWVCGRSREFVRTPTEQCAITHVEALSADEYASRANDGDATAAVAQLEMRGNGIEVKGFRGTHQRCFRPSAVRSWSADGDDILVTTSLKRSGGVGSYRIELGGNCPEIAYLGALSWESGVGLDLICGNPGDVAVLTSDFSWTARRTYDGRACRVAAVHAIDG